MSSLTAKPTDIVPMFASTPGAAGPASLGGGAGSLLSGPYQGRAIGVPPTAPGGGPAAPPTTGLPGPLESSLYGQSLYAAAAAAAQAYLPFGAPESSAFYPHHINGDNSVEAWRNLSAHAHHAAAAWAYDPAVIGYPYGPAYGALDVRRKNATRESTSTLKAWLYEHIKNPYPTKGEKIMLAIITKMTLTQVSTWFANARRRLKKENKMQWSPRNRTGDDDDDDDDNKNIGSDIDDDVIDGRRTPRTICDDSDDIDVGVDTANDDSQSANDLHDIRGSSVSGLDERDVDDCPPHCSLLQRRLHLANSGLLNGPPPSHHHRGFFWNSSAAAAAAAAAASSASSVTDGKDDDNVIRRSRHLSSSSTPPPPPLIAAIDYATQRTTPATLSATSTSSNLRDEASRRPATSLTSNSSKEDDRRQSKTSTEKPRIWSIADVATSGTSNGRRSPSPSANSDRSSTKADATSSTESAAAAVTSGFQPWASAIVDPLSPHRHHHNNQLLHPFRVCIPPPPQPPSSNGLPQLRYGSFSVGAGPSPSTHPAMASHPAALAHQLAAAAVHAAAVHHARLQQQQMQQQQQQSQYSPTGSTTKRESSSVSGAQSPSSVSVSRALPEVAAFGSSKSPPPRSGSDERRTTTINSDMKYPVSGATTGVTGRASSPATVCDDSRDADRKTPDCRSPETAMSSREGSSPVGTAVAAAGLIPTAFKPLPQRR